MRRDMVAGKDDTAGRIVGFGVFLLGIALLVFVAIVAYIFFTTPVSQIAIVPHKGAASGATAVNTLGASAMILAFRVAMLIIITIVGSLMAGKGLQFYYASTRRRALNAEVEDPSIE